MNKNLKHIYTAALLVISLVFTSCHTTKVVTGTLTGAHPERSRIVSVVQNNDKYEAMQLKVKCSWG